MAIINGTSSNNVLAGDAGNDLINGLAGNDTLGGSAGDDTLNGGLGNDTFIVNSLRDAVIEDGLFASGTDTVVTSVLDSLKTYSLERWSFVENLSLASTVTVGAQLKGNAQNNVIKSNSAATVNDTLYGGGGSDTLFSYAGNDSLIGDSGDDSLDGGTGNDMMIGGAGSDTYVIDSAGDRVFDYLNAGFDTIRSTLFKDLRAPWTKDIEGLTYTGTAAATLHGNLLGNSITSLSAAADTLNGYEGSDTLDGGNGNDSMVGGLGDDLYRVSATDVVRELVNEGTDTFVGAKTDISLAAHATTIENLYYTGSVASAVRGNAMDNIVSGGSGSDTVSGNDGNDTLFGGAGGDVLNGGNGEDELYGGGSAGFGEFANGVPDTLRDTLAGGAGDDDYFVDNDLDTISESASGGTLDVVFSSIDNSLTRYANVEALVLEPGSTAWFGQGGVGGDIIVGNNASNYLDGGAGNDTLTGGFGFSGFGFGSADVLEGGAGNDVLVDFDFNTSSFGSDETSLFGGAGNDLYVLGDSLGRYGGLDTAGTDTALMLASGSIEGLEGVENVILFGTGAAEDVAAETAVDRLYRAAFNRDFAGSLLQNNFNQSATGNALANRITGNAQDNALTGLEGNDTLLGGVGRDSLDGGAGIDRLVGGVGDDVYLNVAAGDLVVEAVGEGFDIVRTALSTSYAGFANIEGLSYLGTNSVNLNNGSANTSNDYFEGGAGNDTLQGFGGNDTLAGGVAGNDSIVGGAGNDSLEGDQGNDTIDGGADDDRIEGGRGADSLLGGDGNDIIDVDGSFGTPDVGGDIARGGNGNDRIEGYSLGDKLYGDAGNDSLDGNAGNDTLEGGADNDSLNGGQGADSLLGGDGNDDIDVFGSFGATDVGGDIARGGNGNDRIDGYTLGDELHGDAGNDTITGGAGNDTLSAGSVVNGGAAFNVYFDRLLGDVAFENGDDGADTFVFEAPTVANKASEFIASSGTFYFNAGAIIGDFSVASDTIRLAGSMVGDGDNLLEGVVVDEVAGGTFEKASEMVIFRTDSTATMSQAFSFGGVLNFFDAATVTTVIDDADVAFAVGDKRLFVIDDGDSSAVFQFIAANADAVVTVDELFLVAVVDAYSTAVTGLTANDFLLG